MKKTPPAAFQGISGSTEKQKKLSKFILDTVLSEKYNYRACLKRHMRPWRNWQTRTFEGRVGNSIRVQVSSAAPNQKVVSIEATFFHFYPNATSRTIMTTNPMLNAIVPQLECSPSLISGINSSTTTYIIAPAANASI